MSFEYEFVDDLPSMNTDDKWTEVGKALREHPGRWARVSSSRTEAGASSQAYKINRGENRQLGTGFEAARRKQHVYVRYVGDAT